MKVTEIHSEEKIQNSLKLLVKTSFIVFIGLFISKILGYAYRIIIARYYGPEIYGLFTLALTITSLVIALAAFGLSDGLLRYVPLLRAKNKFNEIKYLLRKTLKIYLISGIISSIILMILSDFISINIFHNKDLSIFIRVMSLWILLSLLTNIYLGVIRGFEKISLYSFIFNIFQNFARVGILLILILIGFNSHGNFVVWSFIIAALLTLALSYTVCRYKISQIFGKYAKKDYSNLNRDFWNYSWPIMFYGLISIIFYWIDSFSLGFYKSAVEVGWYNAAVPIAMLIGFIPELFMQLFFPMINREYSNKNKKIIEQLSKQVTKWIFMAILPVFILIFFFPGAALNILFGPEYLPAENALRLLLIGSFISSLFIVFNNLLSMLGKSKIILFDMLGASILNLLLNSFLVPSSMIFGFNNSNGLLGASLATLISIIFMNILFMIQTKKYLLFLPFRRKMIIIAAISLIPTILLFYLRSIMTLNIFTILLLTAIFILTYVILIFISHSLDENDWMIIRIIWRKIKIISI